MHYILRGKTRDKSAIDWGLTRAYVAYPRIPFDILPYPTPHKPTPLNPTNYAYLKVASTQDQDAYSSPDIHCKC